LLRFLAVSRTAALAIALVAEVAGPAVPGEIEMGVGRNFHLNARPGRLPITAIALPAAARAVEVSVCRYFDGNA
jgi:hypothetical protein